MVSHFKKTKTRTDWRRRPLTENQLVYAIDDVSPLEDIYSTISERLSKLGREKWLVEEMDLKQIEIEQFESGEKWRRLSGATNLSRKELAIVRELWEWREAEARRKNQPARRVLRDDLLVELARRGNSSIKRIRNLRGMEHGRLQRFLPQISATINRGLNQPKNQWPEKDKQTRLPNLGLLGQFLATALGVICRDAQVAPNLVGTSQQLRTLAAWRLGLIELEKTPQLMCGWRGEIIGEQIDRLLAGDCSIRIDNPASDQPLIIENASETNGA